MGGGDADGYGAVFEKEDEGERAEGGVGFGGTRDDEGAGDVLAHMVAAIGEVAQQLGEGALLCVRGDLFGRQHPVLELGDGGRQR